MSSGGFIDKIPGATGGSFNNGWKGLAGIKGDGHYGLNGGGIMDVTGMMSGGQQSPMQAAGGVPQGMTPLQAASGQGGMPQPQQQFQQSPVMRAMAMRRL